MSASDAEVQALAARVAAVLSANPQVCEHLHLRLPYSLPPC